MYHPSWAALENAQFPRIYRTGELVYIQGTEEQVATLVTDAKGYARVDEIPEGNYHIRELKAAEGYALDTASATVTVTAGQTVTYSCQDIPQSNPVTVLLSKIDAETNQN